MLDINFRKEPIYLPDVKWSNTKTEQVFVFYNEEIRLTDASGEIIFLKDYKMETSFDPNAETNGILLFLVTEGDKKFMLQLDKESLPKIELELDICRTKLT